MRKLMEVWVDEKRGFLSVKYLRREYRLFGGFEEHQDEEDLFKLGDGGAAVRFMLKYFNVTLKEPIIVKKINQDKWGNTTEIHTHFKLGK